MKKAIPMADATLLFLITMLLVIVVGAPMQAASFSLGLIATEVVCIFLPAVLLLQGKKVNFSESLRLRWPGWKLAGMSVLLGVAVWSVDALLESVLVQVMGYTPGLPPAAFPKDVLGAVLVMLGMAVFAPICEEILFRGVLQRSFEARGTKFALVLTALLFAFYHMRFQGLLALLPVAFLLGYVLRRTGSLVAAMLVHFGNNFAAGLIMVFSSLRPGLSGSVNTVYMALLAASLPLLVLGLWALGRTKPLEDAVALEEPAQPQGFLRRYWPLGVAGGIYLVMAASEIIWGLFPGMLAVNRPLELGAMRLEQPVTLNYQVFNRFDEPVGSVTCSLNPDKGEAALQCTQTIKAYQSQRGGTTWASGAYMRSLDARWALADMSMVEVTDVKRSEDSSFTSVQVRKDSGQYTIAVTGTSTGTLTFNESLVDGFWMWQLTGLAFDTQGAQMAPFLWPTQWDESQFKSVIAQTSQPVVLLGGEPLALPAGNFTAWKVEVSREARLTAWYDEDTHLPVQWTDYFHTYKLTDIKTTVQ
ncbi:MAG TPA: type II CAAX endopeptidase family protein [Anaerolineaceae bacterium]|nr:type II CAAX endopeptidase family protein [Anaerolineaceae bacterium]HPN50788.1 type II CAAX endopeptidase family protein [Anaerolineaceae bacterium]